MTLKRFIKNSVFKVFTIVALFGPSPTVLAATAFQCKSQFLIGAETERAFGMTTDNQLVKISEFKLTDALKHQNINALYYRSSLELVKSYATHFKEPDIIDILWLTSTFEKIKPDSTVDQLVLHSPEFDSVKNANVDFNNQYESKHGQAHLYGINALIYNDYKKAALAPQHIYGQARVEYDVKGRSYPQKDGSVSEIQFPEGRNAIIARAFFDPRLPKKMRHKFYLKWFQKITENKMDNLVLEITNPRLLELWKKYFAVEVKYVLDGSKYGFKNIYIAWTTVAEAQARLQKVIAELEAEDTP